MQYEDFKDCCVGHPAVALPATTSVAAACRWPCWCCRRLQLLWLARLLRVRISELGPAMVCVAPWAGSGMGGPAACGLATGLGRWLQR